VNELIKEPMELSMDGLPISHLVADLPKSMPKQVRGSICAMIALVSISYRYEYNNLAFRYGSHTMVALLFAKDLVVIKICSCMNLREQCPSLG
jgi:hypothetical protein